MRTILASSLLALVMVGCGRPGARVDRSFAGTWVLDWWDPEGAQVETKDTIDIDGHWTSRSTFTLSNNVRTTESRGAVEVKEGFMIRTMSSGPSGVPYTNRSLIVRVNERELVLKELDTEFIYRRQK